MNTPKFIAAVLIALGVLDAFGVIKGSIDTDFVWLGAVISFGMGCIIDAIHEANK